VGPAGGSHCTKARCRVHRSRHSRQSWYSAASWATDLRWGCMRWHAAGVVLWLAVQAVNLRTRKADSRGGCVAGMDDAEGCSLVLTTCNNQFAGQCTDDFKETVAAYEDCKASYPDLGSNFTACFHACRLPFDAASCEHTCGDPTNDKQACMPFCLAVGDIFQTCAVNETRGHLQDCLQSYGKAHPEVGAAMRMATKTSQTKLLQHMGVEEPDWRKDLETTTTTTQGAVGQLGADIAGALGDYIPYFSTTKAADESSTRPLLHREDAISHYGVADGEMPTEFKECPLRRKNLDEIAVPRIVTTTVPAPPEESGPPECVPGPGPARPEGCLESRGYQMQGAAKPEQVCMAYSFIEPCGAGFAESELSDVMCLPYARGDTDPPRQSPVFAFPGMFGCGGVCDPETVKMKLYPQDSNVTGYRLYRVDVPGNRMCIADERNATVGFTFQILYPSFEDFIAVGRCKQPVVPTPALSHCPDSGIAPAEWKEEEEKQEEAKLDEHVAPAPAPAPAPMAGTVDRKETTLSPAAAPSPAPAPHA